MAAVVYTPVKRTALKTAGKAKEMTLLKSVENEADSPLKMLILKGDEIRF